MNLHILTNATREAAFASLREKRRLISLREMGKGEGLEGKLEEETLRCSLLFKKWYALKGRRERDDSKTTC